MIGRAGVRQPHVPASRATNITRFAARSISDRGGGRTRFSQITQPQLLDDDQQETFQELT